MDNISSIISEPSSIKIDVTENFNSNIDLTKILQNEAISSLAANIILGIGLVLSAAAVIGGVMLSFAATVAPLAIAGSIVAVIGGISSLVLFTYIPLKNSKNETPNSMASLSTEDSIPRYDSCYNNRFENDEFQNDRFRGDIPERESMESETVNIIGVDREEVSLIKGLSGGSNRCFLNACLQNINGVLELRNKFDSEIYHVPDHLPNRQLRVDIQNCINEMLTRIENTPGKFYCHNASLIQELFNNLNTLAKNKAVVDELKDGRESDSDELLKRILAALDIDVSLTYNVTYVIMNEMGEKSFDPTLGIVLEGATLDREINQNQTSVFRYDADLNAFVYRAKEKNSFNYDSFGEEGPSSMDEYLEAFNGTHIHNTPDRKALIEYQGKYYYFDNLQSMIIHQVDQHQQNFPPFLVFSGVNSVEEKGLSFTKSSHIELCGQQYRLKSAICHSGSSRSGHYIAGVYKDNQYYVCNDSIVKECNLESKVFQNARLWIYEKV